MKKYIITVLLILSVTTCLLFNKVNNSFTTELKKANTLGSNETLEAIHEKEVVDASIGKEHNLFVTADGVVYSMGRNNHGQLGLGPSGVEVADVNIPHKVVDNSDEGFINGDPNNKVIAVSAGDMHSLILTENGTVYSFGSNSYGMLGIGQDEGNLEKSNIPLKLVDNFTAGFTNGNPNNKVVSIRATNFHNLILTENGTVYSFGRNNLGQLGVDDLMPESSIPLRVVDNTDVDVGFINGDPNNKVIAIRATNFHNLTLTENGMVFSFGYNWHGQLGIGISGFENSLYRYSAIALKVFDNLNADLNNVPNDGGEFINGNPNNKVVEISAGETSSYVITADGTAYAFGYNKDERLALGISDLRVNIPTRISDNPNEGFINGDLTNKVIQVAGGSSHAAVLTERGKMFSFGSNSYGQLGTGDLISKNIATKVVDNVDEGYISDIADNKVIKIIASNNETFFITNSMQLYGFGINSYGKLGNSLNSAVQNPTKTLLNIGYKITGTAIQHDINSEMKYSTNVEITDIQINNSKIEIKTANGNYVDISSEYNSTSDGGINKFIIGESTTISEFKVLDGEEKRFTIKIVPIAEPNNIIENTIIIDKKPPIIEEIIESGNTSVCNVINNNEYYCNSSVSFIESTDLSEFYLVKKEVLGVETDITLDIRNGLINELATANTEKSKITYTLIDGAGNQTIVKLILDNYTPRIELK